MPSLVPAPENLTNARAGPADVRGCGIGGYRDEQGGWKRPRFDHAERRRGFLRDSVPRRRVAQARELIESADAVLIVGSSLMVFSSFRFCRLAHEPGIPLLAVNRGLTRADPWLALKVERACAEVLPALVGRLRDPPVSGRRASA